MNHKQYINEENKMSPEKCIEQTKQHIEEVANNLRKIADQLIKRGLEHDKSKLGETELPYFTEYTHKLKTAEYGSDIYKQWLKELKPALDHHYANNRHHPEHFENGIQGMNIVDVLEMFCDWLASTKRGKNGDIKKSCHIQQERFKYSDDLKQIFLNTCDLLE